jgi:hypothetical protein
MSYFPKGSRFPVACVTKKVSCYETEHSVLDKRDGRSRALQGVGPLSGEGEGNTRASKTMLIFYSLFFILLNLHSYCTYVYVSRRPLQSVPLYYPSASACPCLENIFYLSIIPLSIIRRSIIPHYIILRSSIPHSIISLSIVPHSNIMS